MQVKRNRKFERLVKVFKIGISSYTFIAAVIIAFGGLIQVLILLEMNLTFLRFFSSTQMLNDGLIGLILISPFLVFGIVSYIFFWDSDKYFNIIYLFLLLICLPVIFIFGNVSFDTTPEAVCWTSFILTFTLLGAHIFFSIFKKLNNTLLKLTSISLFIAFISLFFIDEPSHRINIFNHWENSLANKDDLVCHLKKQPYFTEDYKILYFNDEYIFVRFHYASDEKIRIFPFETMFEHSECVSD